MDDLKITVDQLKNYMGTGLAIQHPWGNNYHWELHYDTDANNNGTCSLNYALETQANPVCYRLSDLDKQIEINGERFVPINEICNLEIYGYDELRSMFKNNFSYGSVYSLSYEIFKKLFEWHFWPFGDEYFEQGLVLDKMKISKK